jgi:hypothetical protein
MPASTINNVCGIDTLADTADAALHLGNHTACKAGQAQSSSWDRGGQRLVSPSAGASSLQTEPGENTQCSNHVHQPAMMPSSISSRHWRMDSAGNLVDTSSLSRRTPGTSVISTSFSAWRAAAICNNGTRKRAKHGQWETQSRVNRTKRRQVAPPTPSAVAHD